MAVANKNLHLTLEERKIILKGIESAASKTDIANTLGKDKSTIGKEIKKYRIKVYSCHLPLECANYKACRHYRNCRPECIDFKQFRCNRRDRSPGACNGCPISQVMVGLRAMLVRILGFLGNFATNGWAAGQVCNLWMVSRANLQVMGALDTGTHPLLANLSEIQEIRNREP
ncbi:MAG: helix-turn-helix domain-containing protein [Eubacteriales bacterium]|nr:helix-turn-helix domain-containing protein [Eubacteriales bacterium]